MELLRQTGERTIDHADVQWCIAGGFVIDSRPDGMEIAVTIMGRDREGGFLHVFATLPFDGNLPLFIDDFLLT
jgi:hypothetical protein